MHAHGIEVFNRADNDRVIGQVAHHFEFELFPAKHALFDEDLMHRRKVQTALENLVQIFPVVSDAASAAAQREAAAKDHPESDPVRESYALIDIVHELRFRRLATD